MIECDWCDQPATWWAWAAYYTAPEKIHPEYATYPMPMIRGCSVHFLDAVQFDLTRPGTSGAFVIRRMP